MKNQIKIIASSLAFACASMLAFNSCTKIANNLQYDLEMQTATVDVEIPAYDNTTIAISGSQTVDYNIDSFIRANTANMMSVSNITSAKIKSCKLVLNDATPEANFANFKSCNASFFTDGNKTPFKISILDNPDKYATELELPVDTEAELKGYLSGGNKFTYTLGGQLRRATKTAVHATATIAFNIHVQGLTTASK